MPSDDRPSRPGRPRAVPEVTSLLSPREQILDAAAALFVEHGVSATSTRAIAERVGIRQASLYYHFAGKDEMLAELLTTSVRPSLELARDLELAHGRLTPATTLATLVRFDVDTLAHTPHNVGMLYLLPEVQAERYDQFRTDRQELQDAYGRFGRRAATPDVTALITAEQLGGILIQLVETVIQLRRVGDVDSRDREAIAATCLRACGLSAADVAGALVGATRMLAAVDA